MSGKRSRGALRAFLLQAEPAELPGDTLPDPRAHALMALGGEEEEALATIHGVFAGTALPTDAPRLSRLLAVRAEIHKEWRDARDSFLSIGRALLSLEELLTPAELRRLRQSSERLLPFSDATATQLRQIARAVESGRLPYDLCPGSYGTAYQITLLSDRQLRVARERGLVRPDVTRREIVLLRRELTTAGAALPPGRLDRTALRDERHRLAERRQRLAAELAALDLRLGQLDDLLGDAMPDDPTPDDTRR
jgi:hypothetical protein